MGFTLQGAGPFLHWLTLGILCMVPVLMAVLLYRLGGLPGAIARTRGHPQADAINVCGWMGIITLVLWPVALVWAHLGPRPSSAGNPAKDDIGLLLGQLREASQRIAVIESRLSNQPAKGGA